MAVIRRRKVVHVNQYYTKIRLYPNVAYKKEGKEQKDVEVFPQYRGVTVLCWVT